MFFTLKIEEGAMSQDSKQDLKGGNPGKEMEPLLESTERAQSIT